MLDDTSFKTLAAPREIKTDSSGAVLQYIEEEDDTETAYSCKVDPSIFIPINSSNTTTTYPSNPEFQFQTVVDFSRGHKHGVGTVRIHKRKLLLIMTSGRSGSTLLLWIFLSLQHFTTLRDLDLLSLSELFHRDWGDWGWHGLWKIMVSMCSMMDGNDHQEFVVDTASNDELPLLLRKRWQELYTEARRKQFPSDNHTSLLDFLASQKSSPVWLQELVQKTRTHQTRIQNPLGILKFVRSIPALSSTNHNYALIKVLDYQTTLPNTTIPSLEENKTNRHQPSVLDNFFDMIQHTWKGRLEDIKVVVLWRRSFFDHYVSEKVAIARGDFFKTNDSGNNKTTVMIQREQLKNTYQYWKFYNYMLHTTLSKKRINYTVVEYEDNLQGRAEQKATAKRMIEFLGLNQEQLVSTTTTNDDAGFDAFLDSLIDFIPLKKQSTTPTEDQVSNWDEVVQWNVTPMGNLEGDWDDLF